MARHQLDVRLESEDFDCDHVQVHRLDGRERISRLYRFELEIVSPKDDGLTRDALAAAEVAIVFRHDGEPVRRIYGMVCEVEDRLDGEDEHDVFRIVVVPRAWRLTLVETLEIYLDMSVPEIIEKKLELVGLVAEDFELRLQESYPQREFVVQYKETDLAFISRLVEHLGISFLFAHDDGRDRMVFTDFKGGFRPIAGEPVAPFRGRGEQIDLYALTARRRLVPSTYVVRDYNYRLPDLELQEQHDLQDAYAGGVIEYGGHFKTPEEGKRLALVRAEERAATREVFEGRTSLATFEAGGTFEVQGHPRENPTLLLVEVEHSLQQNVRMGGEGSKGTYHNRFEAVPMQHCYRPPRATPVPHVAGVITGIVEPDGDGGVGKLAKIDDQGRYTVRFLFDTAAPGERRASRPVRRMQPTVGPNYGMHFPLRPGIEVKIAFVEGDPDRPVIVGAVPNPRTPTPVDATESTKNRIRTESGVTFEIDDGAGS